jgi:peptidoglycan hydrolase CwlO-like protein
MHFNVNNNKNSFNNSSFGNKNEIKKNNYKNEVNSNFISDNHENIENTATKCLKRKRHEVIDNNPNGGKKVNFVQNRINIQNVNTYQSNHPYYGSQNYGSQTFMPNSFGEDYANYMDGYENYAFNPTPYFSNEANQELMNKINSMEAKLSVFSEENKKLKCDNNEKANQILNLSSRIDKLDQKNGLNEAKNNELEKKLAEQVIVNTKLAESQIVLSEIHTNKSKLIHQINQLQKVIHSKNEELDSLTKENKNLSEKQLEINPIHKKRLIEDSAKLIDNLSLKKEIKDLKKNVDNQEKRINYLKKNNESQEKKINSLRGQLQSKTSENEELDNENSTLVGRVNELQDLAKNIMQLKESNSNKLSKKISKKDNKISQLNDKINELYKEIDSLINSKNVTQNKLNEYKKHLTISESLNQELNKKIDQSKREINELREENEGNSLSKLNLLSKIDNLNIKFNKMENVYKNRFNELYNENVKSKGYVQQAEKEKELTNLNLKSQLLTIGTFKTQVNHLAERIILLEDAIIQKENYNKILYQRHQKDSNEIIELINKNEQLTSFFNAGLILAHNSLSKLSTEERNKLYSNKHIQVVTSKRQKKDDCFNEFDVCEKMNQKNIEELSKENEELRLKYLVALSQNSEYYPFYQSTMVLANNIINQYPQVVDNCVGKELKIVNDVKNNYSHIAPNNNRNMNVVNNNLGRSNQTSSIDNNNINSNRFTRVNFNNNSYINNNNNNNNSNPNV